jgi:hypothetical protein
MKPDCPYCTYPFTGDYCDRCWPDGPAQRADDHPGAEYPGPAQAMRGRWTDTSGESGERPRPSTLVRVARLALVVLGLRWLCVAFVETASIGEVAE